MSEPKLQGKSYDIPKRLVWDAWLKVKSKGGAAGADGVTIQQFEENVKNNLYKLWNRMSSGSYFPGPGPRGGDTQERWDQDSGYPERGRQDSADSGGARAGAERGTGVPRRLVRVPTWAFSSGRGEGVPGTVFQEGLDRR